jgi:hypothetical protein
MPKLIGKVVEVGFKVTKVKVVDNVRVGCVSDAFLDFHVFELVDDLNCYNGKNFHT